MSRVITIQEGLLGRSFDAAKLRTSLSGGGQCLWVPESEITPLAQKSVDANGVYVAAAEGAYAFSEIRCNVVSDVIYGKGSDGNEYKVSKGTGGEVSREKLISRIAVTTPPDYIGPYGKGAYISYDGLVVTAYDANDVSMGEIPLGQLVLPMQSVPYDLPEQDFVANSDIASNVYFSMYRAVAKYTDDKGVEQELEWKTPNGGIALTGWTGNRVTVKLAAKEPYAGYHSTYTHDGKTIYYNQIGLINAYVIYYVAPTPITGGYDMPSNQAAWTALYGETSGGVQVPVQYLRPGDGKTLETSFGIEVVDVVPRG